MEIKFISPEDLIPYVNNARVHSAEQVAQIAGAIKEFGFKSPIITDGENGVLAGHGRLKAALLLGLKEVPVIEAADLTESQRKAYILADNKIGDNSSFDFAMVKNELAFLEEMSFDLAVTGFNEFEIGAMDFGGDDSGVEYGGDTGEYEGESSSGEYEGGGDAGSPFSIQYTIVFDTEEQQAKWHAYVKDLKAKYPGFETIAQRIIADIADV
jgi:hypothetical protein